MKLLLDTNAYSAFMRGHTELTYRIQNASQVLLSAINENIQDDLAKG